MIHTLESDLTECARAGELAPCSVEGFERAALEELEAIVGGAIVNGEAVDTIWNFVNEMLEALPGATGRGAVHDDDCWRKHVRCALERVQEYIATEGGYLPDITIGP
jgi:hypothetical protein